MKTFLFLAFLFPTPGTMQPAENPNPYHRTIPFPLIPSNPQTFILPSLPSQPSFVLNCDEQRNICTYGEVK